MKGVVFLRVNVYSNVPFYTLYIIYRRRLSTLDIQIKWLVGIVPPHTYIDFVSMMIGLIVELGDLKTHRGYDYYYWIRNDRHTIDTTLNA